MYFKRIEMHGFKSFAEPVNIEFDRGITCIVGPNGSGKSNISDAIRWVLGEQSPRMLRGGKMEEVIFAGTSSRKSRGMAEVTLTIDNSDGSLPIDYKEVAITRRMFRTGESEYHINGNQCRLRDIRELIMDTGIGVDGYSLIGQGKISDIISNKTESRREIFEEAAGIVAYRTKKAEAERKLTATESNMDRVQDIIGEIESRIDGLRDDSVKAREYLELRDRYQELEINIILKNIENLELKNEFMKDDLSELQLSLDQTKEIKAQTENDIANCNQQSESLEALSVENRDKLFQIIEDHNQAVNKGQIDQERLAAIQENTQRLQQEIQQLQERLDKESENSRRLTLEKEEIDRKADQLNQQLQEKTAGYHAVSEEMTGLMEESDRYKNQIFELSGAINSGKAEINSLQMLQETLERREATILGEKDTGEDSNRDTLDKLNRIKGERQQEAETLEEIRERIETKREQYGKDRSEEQRLSASVEELRISVGQLSSRKKTIEEMESNYEGYNYAVRHVMKSGLSGIHGVVAELIQVPSGYEVAMETALGAALQNIICQDDNSAKAAIRSLKANKAGRMTFLPLSSVRGRRQQDRRLEQAEGFIGFGPDCIQYDPQYQSIMEYLLGRVVLVDHMDHAINMSKSSSGFRYVTLEGEVINAGGAITGGRYRNKTANILDRKAEIAALEKQLSQQREKRENQENLLTQLRERIGSFSREIDALELQRQEAERQVIAKENEITFIETTLKEMKSSSDKLATELDHIQKEKENSRKMIRELDQKIQEHYISIKEAERISEAKLEEYNARKAEVDAVGEEITKARIAVNSCENEKNHVDSMVERIGNTVEEIRQDIRSRESSLETISRERERLTDGTVDMEEFIREKESEKRRLEAYIEELTEEKAKVMRTLTERNQEKKRLDDKLEQLQNQKYELEIKNAKNETQLDTYKNKLWEDFEVSYIQAMEFRSEDFVMSSAVKENRQIKNRMKELGEVNVGAIEEYETVKERYEFLTAQRADIQQARDNLNQIIGEMDQTIKTRFKDSFDRIVTNFEEKFQELFGGGHAELRLSDESDPLESSIDIIAQPPGKKLQNINLLSGGEKTLTAIALMFAVLKAKPTPFCILDEVEAALDDANIDRFIQCLRKFNDIQFALVTHQKATMEYADVLYGVTMPEKGISKVLSLSMGDDFDL